MRVCLGKIAQRDVSRRINLLREQAEVTGISEQAFKERACFIDASLHGEIIYQPEGTDDECALATYKPVVGNFRAIAIDEAMFIGQMLHDAIDGGAHPWVIRSDKADQRQQEIGGIQHVAV